MLICWKFEWLNEMLFADSLFRDDTKVDLAAKNLTEQK